MDGRSAIGTSNDDEANYNAANSPRAAKSALALRRRAHAAPRCCKPPGAFSCLPRRAEEVLALGTTAPTRLSLLRRSCGSREFWSPQKNGCWPYPPNDAGDEADEEGSPAAISIHSEIEHLQSSGIILHPATVRTDPAHYENRRE